MSDPSMLEKGAVVDEGKGASLNSSQAQGDDVAQGHVDTPGGWRGVMQKVATIGRVELRGIQPIPVEERTSTQFSNVFTIWWCMNANLLP